MHTHAHVWKALTFVFDYLYNVLVFETVLKAASLGIVFGRGAPD